MSTFESEISSVQARARQVHEKLLRYFEAFESGELDAPACRDRTEALADHAGSLTNASPCLRAID